MDLFHDISIIILNLEDSLFLERCIRSCFAQTLPGYSFEVLLVSKSDQQLTRKVIEHYQEQIKPIYVEQNINFRKALEEGLNHASGRYILLVEANDFLSDYCLLVQSIFLYDNPVYRGVSTDYWLVEADSDTKIKRNSALEAPQLFGVMYRKELVLKEVIEKRNEPDFSEDRLKELLFEGSKIGHLPISFYRRQMSDKKINQFS